MKIYFPLSPYNQQRQFEKPVWVYPAHLAMYATYLWDQGHEVLWGKENRDSVDRVVRSDADIDMPFEKLPYPDRALTDAMNPRWQAYGNYKHHPATHMMASNLCWWGKCTFCVDKHKLDAGEKRAVRSVDHCIAEIDDLINKGYKEVFDDSGTFPVGPWLKEFCGKMIWRGRHNKIKIGCNMKPIDLDYTMMKDAGFRMILVGLESANQETLDRIKKGQKLSEALGNIVAMNKAGLEVHISTMFGFLWETHADAMRTVSLIHYLLKKGYVKTVQASVFSPPRTEPDRLSKGAPYIQKVYDIYKNPLFWWRKIIDIRCREDITYLLGRINHLWKAK